MSSDIPKRKANAQAAERLVRVRSGTSQGTFAAQLGVAQNTLGHYERAERSPDLNFLIRLKALAGVDLNWLATGEWPVEGPFDLAVLQGCIEAVLTDAPDAGGKAQAKLVSRLYIDRIKVQRRGMEAVGDSTSTKAS